MREDHFNHKRVKTPDFVFSEQGIQAFFPADILKKAKLVLRRSTPQYSGFMTKDRIVEITVKKLESIPFFDFLSYSTPSRETVTLQLDLNRNRVHRHACSCWIFQHHGTCEHSAAAVLDLLRQYRENGDFSFLKEPESSISIQRFFKQAQPVIAKRLVLPKEPVCLQPYIQDIGEDSQSLSVGFRIGYEHARMYVVKNITNLVYAVRRQEQIRYGKALDFTHSIPAFDEYSRTLLRFLSDRVDLEKADEQGTLYYAGRTERNLILRGLELDAFMRLARQGTFFYMSKDKKQLVPLTVTEAPFPLRLYLEKAARGFLVKGKAPAVAVGAQYLYLLQDGDYTLHILERKTPAFEKLIRVLHMEGEETIYISSRDVAGFSQLLLPLVRQQMVAIQGPDFELTRYVPQTPDFEMHLDLPQPDLLTCHAWAVYADGRRYSLFRRDQDAASRDLQAEQAMDTWLSSWFTAFNPIQDSLSIRQDDDKLYRLIKEGIAEMRLRGDVYISEALKPIMHTRTLGMHVGVRLTQDRLLELDMDSKNYSMPEIAEIMSRYNPKKKFYRLKSGEFIAVDDSLKSFASLKDALAMSAKDLAKGLLHVPVYRLLYLAKAADMEMLGISLQNDVRQLIRRMKDTENILYEIPKMHAVLRPYQEEGFRWLCALRDNGFAGLLADEMGLGKTLQVIALLQAWRNRKRTLIVCPASLVYNWGEEMERFAPELPYSLVIGAAARREETIDLSPADGILVTSYDALKRDFSFYEKLEFSCEIIDEAQYIKNADTQTAQAVKSIRSAFRVALTGTPIENRLSELWSIFDYLLPGYLFAYSAFRNRFEIPIVRDQDKAAEMRLKEMIQPFVLRRIKQDVLRELPPKIEEIAYAPLADEQKELYEARVQRLKIMLVKQSDKEFKENKILVLSELTKLRELCCDPRLLYEGYAGNSAKLEMCMDLVASAVDAGHKILLFSQFTSMLGLITERLRERDISYFLLQGSTPSVDRAKFVRQFQSDDTPVFCISLKAGGTGLNLSAADIVIHYDPWWNTAVENQASDRAHRIGQVNSVNIYKLIVKGTIEEKILALQGKKSDLADHILSGEGFASAHLSRQDLLNILES